MHIRREDFQTNAWKRFEKDMQARLQELREQNDGETLTDTKTALIRGRIDEVKRILALAKQVASAGSEEQPD